MSLCIVFSTFGGFRDYGAWGRSHLRGPCLKIFVKQDHSLSSFSSKLPCLMIVSCIFLLKPHIKRKYEVHSNVFLWFLC